ncbi:MAG: recombinase [Citrobacter freundii]|nr:MAG: recombinase [Citrobacter freundii]
MEKSFGLMFFLRKPKVHRLGDPVPIYLKITVNEEPKELSCKRSCNRGLWNSSAGRLNGRTDEAKSINRYLDAIQAKVYASKTKLMEMGLEITAERLKCLVQDQPIPDQQHTLLEAFALHNQKMEALVGIDYAEATYVRFETTYAHTVRFLQFKYGLDDINVTKLNYEFIEEFEFWFKTIRKCNHNSTIKYLTNLRKVIKTCLMKKWLVTDPFFGFTRKKKKVDRTPLLDNEIKALSNKQFTTERLTVVRDIFLFSCYTGLSYADVKKLKQQDIFIGNDGYKWIRCTREKSETTSNIPLLPVAEKILAKYATDPTLIESGRCLPVRSNQKSNEYLKEIQTLCGINKKLTTHIARHTFATTVTLSKKVPIETVSKMLAHRSITTTQIYSKVLDEKVSADMMALRNAFPFVGEEFGYNPEIGKTVLGPKMEDVFNMLQELLATCIRLQYSAVPV